MPELQQNKYSPQHHSYHHKPYHPHHIGLGTIAAIIILISSILLAVFYTRDIAPPPRNINANVLSYDTEQYITSSRGFSLSVDTSLFEILYSESENGTVSELAPLPIQNTAETEPKAIATLSLTPTRGTASPAAIASRLYISHTNSIDSFNSDNAEALLDTVDNTLALIRETPLTIGNYTYTTWTFRINAINTDDTPPIYSHVLRYNSEEHGATTVLIQGIIDNKEIPRMYESILESLSFDQGKTLGVNTFGQFNSTLSADPSNQQYITDLVSPAVVKIYHVLCGRIQISSTVETFDQCRAVTGSGFLISQDGLIATNGHVVVYEPRDALVDALVGNPETIAPLLSPLLNISDNDMKKLRTQPAFLARTVSQIYELPEGSISFEEKNEALLVSLGSRPLLPSSDEDVQGFFSFRDTRDIKNATLLAYDYTAEDQLNLLTGDTTGFTKSDVALLRIPIQNTPVINMAQPADISRGQSIAILGFPSDAENNLVDISELIVTNTYGSISSIRTAAGGNGRLFQTDSDASQGNSGGPAINQNSEVIGLLTYRFKDDTTQNAAKSYIRDIDDIRELLASETISLDLNSKTQISWREGLTAYANGRFSDALPHFQTVAASYPQHRLVYTYLNAAQQNIAAGLDRTTPPIQFFVGIAVGLALLALAARLMVTHHDHHQRYKETLNHLSFDGTSQSKYHNVT